MNYIKVENAWVEFSVPRFRGSRTQSAETGGAINSEHGVVVALQDISFELRDGDRLGLVGHNGAGKTTLLRLLAGVYSPMRGRVSRFGHISTLFSSTPGLNANGTGRENIIICGLHLGMTRRKIASKMDEIVEFSELGKYVDLPVRIYSTGMLTRLGFSIATAMQPEILILDEGLATGDARFAQKAQKKMQELIETASIIVIASHSHALVSKICTRCLLLEHGRVVADGPASTLVETYRNAVVNAARNDDPDSLHRAYVLATDAKSNGKHVPPDLEEQGLRYALCLQPDDMKMLRRYANLLEQQGKSVPAEVDVRLILEAHEGNPIRLNRQRLESILNSCCENDLPLEIRERAEALLRNSKAI
jgi:ABC-2 type transport system ATP-binding protein/lipopolysaccharide transport system ATP-binding protein